MIEETKERLEGYENNHEEDPLEKFRGLKWAS
jgi:hypothetical protein